MANRQSEGILNRWQHRKRLFAVHAGSKDGFIARLTLYFDGNVGQMETG